MRAAVQSNAILPPASRLNAYRAPSDFLDVFSISIAERPELQTMDIRLIADHMVSRDPVWVKRLLKLRDLLVKPLGLKTTADLAMVDSNPPVTERGEGDRIAFFRIFVVDNDEIVLGEDDKHQDFRLSLYRTQGADGRLFVATCCRRHNLAGHAYLWAILPFHKFIVKTGLRTALGTPSPTV
ncbi:DUF2867 domain-containing protein [Roseibium denhamense]|uniref:DUF2867 domain-containing protein n=1 Tax=Roseibium denhamense TaxID=76305 RepID=A0ABY1P806_9HYPH|nr:DUF2867 domain-containing protein [Roseibium denhamense]MTI07105.1 DUF2867 domain-containing protein [Roseibium denhamense]SMP27101.1 Protein of unknown function [Roseibium denhamense]